MNSIRMPRHAKGKRPKFFPEEPAADRLMTILMALVTEVAVVRERLDTFERLADEKGVVSREDIEAYEPSIEAREEREGWRQTYLDRILQVLADEVEEQGAPPPRW